MSDGRGPAATADPTMAEFSPGLGRRLLAPIVGGIFPRLLGREQRMRVSQFEQLTPGPGQVVMLGDSITAQGLWHEWFPGTPVINRGIPGDTTRDLLRRVDSAVRQPAIVLVLVGTNDLTSGVPLKEIVGNLRALLTEIDRRAPGAPIVVQSVMPRTPRFRSDIQLLNAAYRAVVEDSHQNVEFLDLWPVLADEEGCLRGRFTEDGLHLAGEGYAAWVEVLRPCLHRLAPSS